MKHGSLFSGIGGFDLAAEWVGWENVLQVENDKFCNKVLKKNFPKVKRYGDIKEFKGHKGQCDIISGGFPCQPFSHAGKRQGETDDRYLWPEMLRVISEIKPLWVVGENVAGLISLENGKTLERIFTDLEAEGYEVESFIIPAASVGAWHKRERIWIVARNSESNTVSKKREIQKREDTNAGRICKDVPDTNTGFSIGQKEKIQTGRNTPDIGSKDVSDTEKQGLEGTDTERNPCTGGRFTEHGQRGRETNRGIAESGLGRMATRLSPWLDEPDIPRVAKGIKNRTDRLKGLGNSIVPQVAYELFKAIEYDNQN